MIAMAVEPKKLDVHRGLTLEAAITVTMDELDRRCGTRPATQEESDGQFDLLPSDGEG